MIRSPTNPYGLKSQLSVKIDWEPAKIPEEKFNNVSCCHNYSKVNTLLSTPNKANIYKESRIKKNFHLQKRIIEYFFEKRAQRYKVEKQI